MRFRMGAQGADPARTVFVDGSEAGFRTLSHWPGHTTPEPLRHDLSTGSALAWAAASPADRRAWIGDFDQVANNHYDTDGVLSAFAVLRPDQALPRAERMLRAAATGDFGTWNGPDALAIDLTVMALPDHPESPLAGELAGLDDRARWELASRYAVEQLPAWLDEPRTLERLWADEHAAVVAAIAALEAGRGARVEDLPDQDLVVVHAEEEPHRVVLHHAAGNRYRVLLVLPGPRCLFCYRDESWFDLVHPVAAPRVPLDAAVEALNDLERAAGGDPCWWADDLQRPVVQLRHRPQRGSDGFGAFHLAADPPTALNPTQVRDTLVAHLAEG